MQFRLDSVICDPDRREMVVIYDRLRDEKISRSCEFMHFDITGKQVEGEAIMARGATSRWVRYRAACDAPR
jgi:hypothetical protein